MLLGNDGVPPLYGPDGVPPSVVVGHYIPTCLPIQPHSFIKNNFMTFFDF